MRDQPGRRGEPGAPLGRGAGREDGQGLRAVGRHARRRHHPGRRPSSPAGGPTGGRHEEQTLVGSRPHPAAQRRLQHEHQRQPLGHALPRSAGPLPEQLAGVGRHPQLARLIPRQGTDLIARAAGRPDVHLAALRIQQGRAVAGAQPHPSGRLLQEGPEVVARHALAPGPLAPVLVAAPVHEPVTGRAQPQVVVAVLQDRVHAAADVQAVLGAEARPAARLPAQHAVVARGEDAALCVLRQRQVQPHGAVAQARRREVLEAIRGRRLARDLRLAACPQGAVARAQQVAPARRLQAVALAEPGQCAVPPAAQRPATAQPPAAVRLHQHRVDVGQRRLPVPQRLREGRRGAPAAAVPAQRVQPVHCRHQRAAVGRGGDGPMTLAHGERGAAGGDHLQPLGAQTGEAADHPDPHAAAAVRRQRADVAVDERQVGRVDAGDAGAVVAIETVLGADDQAAVGQLDHGGDGEIGESVRLRVRGQRQVLRRGRGDQCARQQAREDPAGEPDRRGSARSGRGEWGERGGRGHRWTRGPAISQGAAAVRDARSAPEDSGQAGAHRTVSHRALIARAGRETFCLESRASGSRPLRQSSLKCDVSIVLHSDTVLHSSPPPSEHFVRNLTGRGLPRAKPARAGDAKLPVSRRHPSDAVARDSGVAGLVRASS